jgi:phage FluMu protein gp41
MKNLSLKDLITYGLIALGFAVQWGRSQANAEDSRKDIATLQRKIDTVAEIQGDLKALKEISLDSRNRIVRIENRLLKASP